MIAFKMPVHMCLYSHMQPDGTVENFVLDLTWLKKHFSNRELVEPAETAREEVGISVLVYLCPPCNCRFYCGFNQIQFFIVQKGELQGKYKYSKLLL